MREKLYQTTLALAGMAQAAFLIKSLAQNGKVDDLAFQASLNSILQLDPHNITSVFGDEAGVAMGLKALLKVLNGEAEQGHPLIRYIMSLINLEKKIRHLQPVQDNLKKRILQTKKQIEYFEVTHPTVVSNLADIYLQAISSFRFRIIVWGNPRFLNTADIMEKIRALLLAGIRSSVLWRQVGGSRFQFIFSRNKIKLMAKEILATIQKKETV